MTTPASVLANSAGIVVAIGALGTASFGLVDASKVFGGGASNFGYGHIKHALAPFSDALKNAEHDWALTIRANWINGMPKEDQKAAAKSLIRLGLTSKNVGKMAQAGHVDEASLVKVVEKVEQGADSQETRSRCCHRTRTKSSSASAGCRTHSVGAPRQGGRE